VGCVGVDGESGWRSGSNSGQGLYRRPPAILSSREPHGQANRARQQGRWCRPGQHGRAASRRPQRVLQVGQCVWEGGRRTRKRRVVLVVSRSGGRRRLERSRKCLEQGFSTPWVWNNFRASLSSSRVFAGFNTVLFELKARTRKNPGLELRCDRSTIFLRKFRSTIQA